MSTSTPSAFPYGSTRLSTGGKLNVLMYNTFIINASQSGKVNYVIGKGFADGQVINIVSHG